MGQSWGQPKTFKVVLLGLEDSGKTTLLYNLLYGKKIVTQPTVGSNCESFRIEGTELQIWDLGGRPNQRDAWQTYFKKADALIFMVDCAAPDSASAVQHWFHNCLQHNDLANVPVLVYLNKSDVQGAVSVETLVENCGLDVKSHEVHLQRCSAA